MILAAFQQHLSLFQEDQLEVFIPITPTVFAAKHNMHQPMTMEQYNALPNIADLLDRTTPKAIAKYFLYTALHQSHIRRVSYHELIDSPSSIGQITSYIRPPDEDYPTLLQYAQIVTRYGIITLTLELDDDGEVPEHTTGVKLHFDSPSLTYVVIGEASNHPLFNQLTSLPKFTDIVDHVTVLEFLLGNNDTGTLPITNYL